MNVRTIWTNEDFEEMGWHDSYVHAVSFPTSDNGLSLDLDYLFKWVVYRETNLFDFWVSPCILTFKDVSALVLKIDFNDTVGLEIQRIERSAPYQSPNGRLNLWDFEITTNCGTITFKSSGFEQIIKEQPHFSQSQILKRDDWGKMKD